MPGILSWKSQSLEPGRPWITLSSYHFLNLSFLLYKIIAIRVNSVKLSCYYLNLISVRVVMSLNEIMCAKCVAHGWSYVRCCSRVSSFSLLMQSFQCHGNAISLSKNEKQDPPTFQGSPFILHSCLWFTW